ncbi:GPH family glycoside/pentoside/hexuronide:cation symporter [Streptococcus rupicaprae]|uniref:GPH family glycoside/pentoside/hexuronide:cation symporter n=1 Tax=Streptococcus rupicaprae TaxID=759619 RepID=A0ABV2FFW0_9STRE
MSKDTNRMPGSEKITYGFGNLAANLMVTTASTFITFFYTDVVGISVAAAGVVLGLARIFDGISDLLMGSIVDKTKSKYGKARPWLLWMAIPYALSLIFLFSSPSFLDANGKIIWAAVSYIIAMAGVYTATMVPYNAMMGTTSTTQEDRSQLANSRTLFGFVGAFVLQSTTLKIVNFFGETTDTASWTKMAAIYGLISAILLLITFKNSKERVSVNEASQYHQKISAKQSLSSLLQNKYWFMVIGVLLIGFISSGLGGVLIYYAQWVLGDIQLVAVLGMMSFAPIAVGAMLMPLVITRFSKKTLCIAGSVLSLFGLGLIAIAPDNYTMVLIGTVIKGLGLAPVAVAGYAMLGDTADYGEYKTGIRSDGMIFAAGTFGEKVGSGLGAVVLSIVMSMGGYVAQATSQTDSAIFSLKAAFIYIPMIFSALCILILTFYNLDKEYPLIKAELENRKTLRQIAEAGEREIE